jgi:molecular chaperone DnaJ
MASSDHYQTLEIHPDATQAEIKQAYRRLAKQFHPDLAHPVQAQPGSHDQITRINAAYEILGDPSQRRTYDRQRQFATAGRQRTTAVSYAQRQTGQDIDQHLHAWLSQVYSPVNQWAQEILEPLAEQIDQLASDPFDDDLMEEFQDYLNDCRQFLSRAQRCFRSMPNPANMAGVAASLYYCLEQLGDGIEQLEFFSLNYDDYYLHTGQELFRIANGLRWEAVSAVHPS